MVLKFSGIMYKSYSCTGFYQIKHNNEGKDINNEFFNNIQHFIKYHLHVNFFQDGFIMCNSKVPILKIEVVPTINDYMIPVDS